MVHKVEGCPGCTNTAHLVGYMLVCIDGLLGSRVVEQSPVQQSVRHYYEIMGFFKNNGNFLAKLATIGFS